MVVNRLVIEGVIGIYALSDEEFHVEYLHNKCMLLDFFSLII